MSYNLLKELEAFIRFGEGRAARLSMEQRLCTQVTITRDNLPIKTCSTFWTFSTEVENKFELALRCTITGLHLNVLEPAFVLHSE